MQKLFFFLLCSLFIISCTKETNVADYEESLAKNKKNFNLVNSIWNLATPNPSPLVKNDVANWNEWQQFVIELQQKPKSNLTAFQLKTKNLSGKLDSLEFNIPLKYNKPAVKSRIVALNTKIKMLDNFLNLSDVPEKNIKTLLPEINSEIIGLVNQFEEIILKNQIPIEEGESYLLKVKDTMRNANAFKMLDKMNKQDSINDLHLINKNKSPKRNNFIKPK
jgi:hypothetical protein